jgi:hypothetical protein
MPGDDGYELHTHPDLCERFCEVTRGEGPVEYRWGGVIALDRRGVAFAYALGMRAIWFRLTTVPDDLELRDTAAESPPRERPQWVGVDPWQSDIPTAEGLSRLASTAHDARITTEALT